MKIYKSKMEAAAILKNLKITISPHWFDRSPRHLARTVTQFNLTLFSAPTAKISKIEKSP